MIPFVSHRHRVTGDNPGMGEQWLASHDGVLASPGRVAHQAAEGGAGGEPSREAHSVALQLLEDLASGGSTAVGVVGLRAAWQAEHKDGCNTLVVHRHLQFGGKGHQCRLEDAAW